MAEYKIYCLDGNGRIARRHDLEATDDGAAAHAAREQFPEMTCELWCGTRKVAVLPAGRAPVWSQSAA
jgi:hypothetical protein